MHEPIVAQGIRNQKLMDTRTAPPECRPGSDGLPTQELHLYPGVIAT